MTYAPDAMFWFDAIQAQRDARNGHFSTSGYYYKYNPAIHGERPEPATFCGEPITEVDVGWKDRNTKAVQADPRVCGNCKAKAAQ